MNMQQRSLGETHGSKASVSEFLPSPRITAIKRELTLTWPPKLMLKASCRETKLMERGRTEKIHWQYKALSAKAAQMKNIELHSWVGLVVG